MTHYEALLPLFAEMDAAERLELPEYGTWLLSQQETTPRPPIALDAYRGRAKA
jgi:hypothetical protein